VESKVKKIPGNTHENIFTPTKNEYLGIGFADLRFHQTFKKQIIIK